MHGHHGEHGDPVTSWQIFWSSLLPMHRRLLVAARNIGRRFRPLRACCGRPGEPGC